MKVVYDLALRFAAKVISYSANRPWILSRGSKLAYFVEGQKGLLNKIKTDFCVPLAKPVYWFHASSLGEFGVAYPLIRELKSRKDCVIVLTFFSPSGYNALQRVRYDGVDYVFYLPLDTKTNANAFLDIVHPDKAFFAVSEYWVNYLESLYERRIPTYLVSALITRRTPFRCWWGGMFRKAMKAYTHITVLDTNSLELLYKAGFTNCSLAGNPLFDKARDVANTPYHNAIVERFVGTNPLFVAGSLSDQKDLLLVSGLANKYRNIHFLVVPHEISEEGLNEIIYNFRGKARLYSECDENTDFSETQILIIDYMGDLPYLYRYARWAYVGGGFTPYLHSLIEPIVYGVPVAFGPCIRRNAVAGQLLQLGIGQIVCSRQGLKRWFSSLLNDGAKLDHIRIISKDYVQQQCGASAEIINLIQL